MSSLYHDNSKNIRYSNDRKRLGRVVRRNAIRRINSPEKDDQQEKNPENKATNQYVDTSQDVLAESTQLARKGFVKGRQKIEFTKSHNSKSDRDNTDPVNEQNSDNDLKENNHSNQNTKKQEKENKGEMKAGSIRFTDSSENKAIIEYSDKSNLKLCNKEQNSLKETSKVSREEQIQKAKKNFMISRIQKENKSAETRTVAQKVKDSIEESIQAAGKKILKSFSNSYVIIGALLLTVVIVIPGCISLIYSSYSSSLSGVMPLSEEVLAYEETITKYAEKYGIEGYVPVLEAIMMVESQGIGNDPMDASNFSLNADYPAEINDPEYSIETGVHQFSILLENAECESEEDTENLYLALQAYDFGEDYISWTKGNFDSYSESNAGFYLEYELNSDETFDISYVSHVLQYVGIGFGNVRSVPDWNNLDAYINKNPYAASYMGQCTWFAWGRFYEIYGYSPGFYGSGSVCVSQLVAAHPDKFKKSDVPGAGAVFSALGRDHVGIVLAVEGDNVTIQDGNQDLRNNTYSEAQSDWRTITYTLDQLNSIYGGVVFAVPIS